MSWGQGGALSPHGAVQGSPQGPGGTVPGAFLGPSAHSPGISHSCAEPPCGAAPCAHPSEQSWSISLQQCHSAPHKVSMAGLFWSCSSQSSPGLGQPLLLLSCCYHPVCARAVGLSLQKSCSCLSVFSAVLTSTRMLPSSVSPVTMAQSTFLLQKTPKEINSQGRDGAVLKPWGGWGP